MGPSRGAGTRSLHGKMMTEDLDQIAAAYALGILRGAARAAIEARISSDPALQAKVKLWQENFVAVDLAAERQVPPAGLFDDDFRCHRRRRKRASGHADPARRNRRLDRDVAGSDLYGSFRGSRRQAAFDTGSRFARFQLWRRTFTPKAMRSVSCSKAISSWAI